MTERKAMIEKESEDVSVRRQCLDNQPPGARYRPLQEVA